VLLGLLGEAPDEVDPACIEARLESLRQSGILLANGTHEVVFSESRDLVFHTTETLAAHSNGMTFAAFDAQGELLERQTYFSIGGGFIRREGETAVSSEARALVPFPFSNAAELLELCQRHKLLIWQLALRNECAWRTEPEILSGIQHVWETMDACVERGLHTGGILPGGLKVRRRAQALACRLREQGNDSLAALDWVNAYAMAVNEENAAGGRVVTAPTNGAAGIIPAVGRYYRDFVPGANSEGLKRYLLTASVIGVLYKENASISGAEVGCQGEVGVACSMAAGGLVAALGGSNDQVEYAAEIGMEHNLGMTCDPIGGLVQIPCIERNAMGSVKAINASRLALHEEGPHKVSLDQVIETMYQTGLDMQTRYKETSLAGLALNIIEC
jgi:L-serine dehydratase